MLKKVVVLLLLFAVITGTTACGNPPISTKEHDETTSVFIHNTNEITITPINETMDSISLATEQKQSNESTTITLIEDSEKKIIVMGFEQKSRGMLGPITVHKGELSQQFGWENSSNETYYPELNIVDLDYDQSEELVFFLTLGHGTGIRVSEARILRSDLTEIPFPNPIEGIKDKYIDTVEQSEDEITYTITVGHQSWAFTYHVSDAVEWFEYAVLGQHVRYSLIGNEIVASVAVNASIGMGLGTLDIYYGLVDGKFIEQGVSFSPL